jgi:copper chaperone
MITFQVADMSCGHCDAAITQAVRAVDPGARDEVDMTARSVGVESAADASTLATAIREAGYTPVGAGSGGAAPGPDGRG